MSLLLHMLNDM